MRCSALILILSLLLGAYAAAAMAGDPPVPIEGSMLVTGTSSADGSTYSYLLEGSSDNVSLLPSPLPYGDVSPLDDTVVYDPWYEYLQVDSNLYAVFELWKASLDGSNAVKLTAPEGAGPGGINCMPLWSPDASQIAFTHCDPIEGIPPCEAGFQIWVMNADGTDADRVTPEDRCIWLASWAPNGYSLLGHEMVSPHDWALQVISVDTDRSDLAVIPDVPSSQSTRWSPDGSKIAADSMEPDTVGGKPGVWRRLVLTDLDDGTQPVLFEHFVSDSDVIDHLTAVGGDPNDLVGVRLWAGPRWIQWSPTGDRLAFTAAYPFDPWGVHWTCQEEIWICDVATGDLTKITDNTDLDAPTSWNGYNTFPEDPEVTVDNTTVTFSDVTEDGLTTILRDDDPPALPSGYQFCGEYYDVSTTATVAGPITICMTYDEADIPHGNERSLKLMHYNDATGQWENITTFRDTEANIVCGQVDSLSIFGLALEPLFGGFRPPINPDGSSVWKAGRTIPVKFALSDWEGTAITNATCHLACLPWVGESVGAVSESAEAASADAGDAFRYDEEEQQYVYNFSTKGMEPGAYLLEVTAEGWPGFKATVKIGLR